jgi:hypothetical protein
VTASAEVVRILGLSILAVVLVGADEPGEEDEADLDNTGAVRDHFLSLYRRRLPAPDES